MFTLNLEIWIEKSKDLCCSLLSLLIDYVKCTAKKVKIADWTVTDDFGYTAKLGYNEPDIFVRYNRARYALQLD